MSITYTELMDNGFLNDGEWNNRFYYDKNGFKIVDHFGFYRCDSKNMSGTGKKFNDISELNGAYDAWARKKIRVLEQQVKNVQEYINTLKQSLA